MPTQDYDQNDPEATDSLSADQYGVDLELVEKIKAEALIQAGHHTTDQHGTVHASVKQLQFSVLQVMQDRHVATSKRDLATSAVTPFELYQELLPHGPGVQALARSNEEKLAQQLLTRQLWGYANVGISSFVQKNVASLGMVVCEAKVARTKLNEETGKKQPTTELARFLTTDGDLIMTYYTGPAGAAFVRAARKLDAQLGLVAARRPELAVPVARQLGSMVRQAVAAVPHADPRAAAALTAGSESADEQGA
jgi:hypothetical protein